MLSEEIGTVIESSLEIQKTSKHKSIKQQINSLSVSITKLKILKEKWDGKSYYIKAEVKINPEQTLQLLADTVKARGKQKEIDNLNTLLKNNGYKISILQNKVKDLNEKLDNSIPIVKILSKTKTSYIELQKTYTFCKGQEFSLKKIEKKYPDLRDKVFMARSKFNSKYGTSLKTITDILMKNKKYFIKYDTKLNNIFKQMELNPKNELLDFIKKVEDRATGKIESPIIETLLMYNPMYNKYPEKEWKDNFKKTFKSDGTGKAKGIPFEISVPQSWKSKAAWRPNIVRKFINQNGHGTVAVMVKIINLKIPKDLKFTKNEIIEYVITNKIMKTTYEDAILKDYGRFEIENQPGYWQRINMNIQRGKAKANMEILEYHIVYKNKKISISFNAGIIYNKNITKEQQLVEFNKYKPIFTQILNSFILTDQYIENIEPLTNEPLKLYVYKLFNNKFQTIFPDKPYLQPIPKEVLDPTKLLQSLPYKYREQLSKKQLDNIVSDTIKIIKNNQPYVYTDKSRQLSFSVQSTPSNLKHNNYIWHGIKERIDENICLPLKASGRDILSFSSTLDKKNDTYIAIYSYSYFMEGQKVYGKTKEIYYKNKTYKWHIGYVHKSDENIFDDYQHNIKILK